MVLYSSTTFSLSLEVFFLLKRPLRVPHLLIDCKKKGIVSVDDHQIIFFLLSKHKLCICVLFIKLVSAHSQWICCTNLSYDKCFNILPPPSLIPIPISMLDPSYSYFDPERNMPKMCRCFCGVDYSHMYNKKATAFYWFLKRIVFVNVCLREGTFLCATISVNLFPYVFSLRLTYFDVISLSSIDR